MRVAIAAQSTVFDALSDPMPQAAVAKKESSEVSFAAYEVSCALSQIDADFELI